MEALKELVEKLPERHRSALTWFLDRAGTDQPWPDPLRGPLGETFLVTKAKGIYKPAWSQYALSVRQTIGGPYPDREPLVRADGTWLYPYFQENPDPGVRDGEYTNMGLVACWRDRVPVGVLRQVNSKPNVRYHIEGLALVAGWDGGYFFLEGFSPAGLGRPPGPSGELELLEDTARRDLEGDAFEPGSVMDARQRVAAGIVRRQGQPEFRRTLLNAYGSRCAVSGCDAVAALEAAHIMPYLGPNTNHVQNGILLRADLHLLFDLGLIAFDEKGFTVLIATALESSSYAELRGCMLRLPVDQWARPNIEALMSRRRWSGL